MGLVARLRTAALCCLAAGPAGAACQLNAVAVLPLTTQGWGLLIPATVNDEPAQFIVDTGSFATILRRRAAERLGVSMARLGSDSYGVGGVQHTYRGTARHLRVGGLNADGMVVGGSDMLADDPNLSWDGLFGMNMMAAYDIDLDVTGHHLMLFQADGNCRKPAVALAPPLYDVPLVNVINNREADVDITIDGHAIRALVDSGAGHTVMFRSAARRLGVDLSPLRTQPRSARGVGQFAVATMRHVFARVVIGDLTIVNMPIEILDQSSAGPSRVHVGSLMADPDDGEGGNAEMLLGADFMAKVHLWISHSSQRLIMQYPPRESVLPQ